ncbi:MAG TPA: hypothetical protein VL475_08345, partial [Planctomycetaceae bacterium]|nr:hypothetical protein [Planctomycetaceae bacterium]
MENPHINPTEPEPRTRLRTLRPRHIAIAVVIFLVAAVALAGGPGMGILSLFALLALLLVIDFFSGGVVDLTALVVRIAVPVIVTAVMIPFCLVWPGDAGVPHLAT